MNMEWKYWSRILFLKANYASFRSKLIGKKAKPTRHAKKIHLHAKCTKKDYFSTRKANALLGRIILRKYIHFSEIEVHALCFYERIYLVLNQLDWLVMIKTCSVVFLVFCCHALSFLLSTRSFLKADLDALSFCTRQETVTGYDKNM